MSDVLYLAFHERETELVAALVTRLRNSTSQHYQQLDEASLQHRAETLVTGFVTSFRTKPARFVEYIAEIAAERAKYEALQGELKADVAEAEK